MAPPPEWALVSGASSCEALSGIFEATGEPALDNANNWLYSAVWPTRGSLSALLRTSANGMTPNEVSAVRIDIDSSNHLRFSELNAQNRIHKVLSVQRWTCREGYLASSITLSPTDGSEDARDREESQVRIWRGPDGSLIAENTILTAGQSYLHAKKLKPSARFYFRFRPLGRP
jgi:hypothetical protein